MTLRSDITKARELDAKATPGKWTFVESATPGMYSVTSERRALVTGQGVASVPPRRDDAALIAHYRTLVPRLIAQMERMEGALRGLEKHIGLFEQTLSSQRYWECVEAARSALAALDKE